ncbi:MAG: Amino acid adenylation protein, partial [Actinomycetota bacterium]|nr:Amino acid adenylation protein [Actinomycetota bacterium]
PHEMPQDPPGGGSALARTHINVWHDDDTLHVEWVGGAPVPQQVGGPR